MIALTHIPSPNMQAGERTFVGRLAIDHALATAQHAVYRQVVAECGARVVTLDANVHLPDSTFIEDTAVILDDVAILAPLGAPSRRPEQAAIELALEEHRELVRLHLPATIDGGDVLRVGRTLLVGASCRTNAAGIAAIAVLARRHGYQVIPVSLRDCLHLKTACTALPDGRLIVNRAWIDEAALAGFKLVDIPPDEPWGANVAIIGETVLLAAAQAKTGELIQRLGFAVRSTDLSEFAKAEGGTTCLSLLI